MNAGKMLEPVHAHGFDPTEVAIPWKILSERGLDIVFARPAGEQARADRLMRKGECLGIGKPLPRARADAVKAGILANAGVVEELLPHLSGNSG